jgi:hypothetical protein
MTTTNRDQTVVIDRNYHWQEITLSTPRGAKLQLINRKAGVAVYGSILRDEKFFTHWAPLPTFGD